MFSLSAFGSIILIFIVQADNTPWIPVFVAMSKFGISACFNMVFISVVQLTPTMFTASIFGFCNVTARMVTVLAPEIIELPNPTPIIINVICAGIAAFFSLFLVEKLPKYV